MPAALGRKYLSLVRALRDSVRRGDLAPGAPASTVRDLAWRIGVTPGTVARAYQIAARGLVEGGGRQNLRGRAWKLADKAALQPALTDPEGTGVIDLRSPQLPNVGQADALPAR
ncbi:MAG: hypothetical protein R3D53_09845 [Paracoccaceae bacterium]